MRSLVSAAALGGLLAALAPAQSGFPTWSGVLATMSAAAANHPGICQFVDLTATYGTPPTHGGNSLYAVRISDNVAVEEDEPAFLMVACHHGNEYGTPIVALDAIARLTQGYGTDPVITALVDEYEIWIAPVWNPDGYPSSRTNGVGVDLNRNYPFLWSACNYSSSQGAAPGSEPETVTMMAWSEDQRFAKVLDYHSSGRETLYGYRPECGQHVLGSYLQAEATALSQASGYGGAVRGPSSNGEHYQWQLGNYSNYAFLTEISTTQSPTLASAQAEANLLWPGTVWMLQRELPVWGHVTDALTGQPLEARISYVEHPFTQGEQNRSEPRFGRYHAFLPPGNHTLRFELAGYQAQEVPVTVTAGGSLMVDVALSPPGLLFQLPAGLPATVDPAGGTAIQVDVAAGIRTPQPGTGRVHVDSGNGPQTLAMTETTPNSYQASLPGFVCGDEVAVWFSAEDDAGQVWQSGVQRLPTAVTVTVTASDPFEVPSGWTGGQPGDTATTGIWGRTDPVATAAQPGDDHTPTGTQCWVTDGRGGALGAYDVDNGFTTLLSPALDLTGVADPSIRYWRWYSNDQNGQADDVFRVDISGDNGASWINVETIGAASGQASGGWFQHAFRVADFVPPTAQVRLRFVAEDASPGSIVEAAVDDFEVFRVDCDGQVARGGVGCPDSTGAVLRLVQSGAVRLGETVRVGVESGAVVPAFVVVGFDNAFYQGTPLPAPIPGTGAPGCLLQVEPDASLGLVPHGGTLGLFVTPIPSLAGLQLYWQALAFDPALATPVQLAVTDFLVTTIGM